MLNKIFYVLIILILNTNICLSESISLIINNKIITDSNIDDMTKIMLIKSGIKVNDTNINKFKFSAQNIFIKQHIKKNIIKKHLDYTDNINYNKIPIKILYEYRQDKYKWQNYIQETMNKQKYDQEKLNDYFNDIKGEKLRNISIIVIPWHNDRKKSYETIINI